jgi:hypothetical protein
MNFGEPHLDIREPIKVRSSSAVVRRAFSYRNVTVSGKWWLWVFCAFWKLSLRDLGPVTGASSFRSIQYALLRLNGQRLSCATVDPTTAATRFEFDLGGVLDVRRFERGSKEEMWTLYKPNGYCLSVRGDGQYCHELKTSAPSEDCWRKILLTAATPRWARTRES